MKEGFRLCLIYTLQVILMGSVLLMFLDFVLCFLSCLFLFVSFAQFILPVSLSGLSILDLPFGFL
jgi:hypothetical protein